MLKGNLLLGIFVFALQLISFGQNDDLETYQSDTACVNKYINICGDIIFIYPDSAQKYVDTILSISKKTKYDYGLYKAHNLKGLLLWVSNDMDEALIQYKLALKYTNSTEKPRWKAVILSNIGLIYSNIYKFDSAKYYLYQTIQYSNEYNIPDLHNKALFDLSNLYLEQDNYVETARNLLKVRDELEDTNDSILLLHVYGAFGVLYSKVNKFNLSLLYFKKSIDIDQNISQVSNIANTYLNIGQLYFNVGNNLDSAVHYYRKAIVHALPYNKNNIEMSANINQGNVFLKKMQLDSAKAYYEKVLADSMIRKFPNRKAAVMVNLGIYYLEKMNYAKARSFLNTGYAMADKLDILLFKKNALQYLYRLDSITGNYKQSLHYHIAYYNVSDSLQASKANNEIAILEFEKYLENEKYSNQLLINENQLKSKLILLSVAVLIILLVLLYSLYQNRMKIKRLLEDLSHKHKDLQLLNEELVTTNEVLHTQQEELKALNITKDKFFSILGHDLKSPFNSLLGLLNLIDKEWEQLGDKEKRSLIQSLFASSEKTYHLLEDLLNWGKTQQGQIKYKPEFFVIYSQIKKITDLFEAQLIKKNQKLVIDVSPDLKVNTDIMLFSQITQNLVNNAIKYTHQGGTITVKAEITKNEIQLCIVDTGIGIPKDRMSTLFDLDSDFNRPGTENEKSTGMGLILSKEYAEIINAKLTVSSIEGKGSAFCLIFPVVN